MSSGLVNEKNKKQLKVLNIDSRVYNFTNQPDDYARDQDDQFPCKK